MLNIVDDFQAVQLNEIIENSGVEDISITGMAVLVSTEMDNAAEFNPDSGELILRPNEGIIIG